MRKILFLIMMSMPLFVFAAVEVHTFNDPSLASRYDSLTHELRCLVCQNQDLADSNAELAHDLRQEIYEKLNSGQSDKQIVGFLVNRYGNYVLYRPPLIPTTWLLWGGPFLLLIIGLFVLRRFIRHPAQQAPVTLTNEERQKIQDLLKNKESDK